MPFGWLELVVGTTEVVVGGAVVDAGGAVVVTGGLVVVGGGVVVGGAVWPNRAKVVKCVIDAVTVFAVASTMLVNFTHEVPFHQAIYRLFSDRPEIPAAV